MSASLARALLVIPMLLVLPSLGWAWGSDLKVPPPAPVVDEFGLLDSSESGRLASVLQGIKAKSGVEISVFIPATLQDRVIEDFSIAVAEQWKLGRKKEDKALLFVIAPKERKMRLEVGYGMEGEITDAFSRRLLDDVMRPYFRAGRYVDGILACLVGIQQKVNLGLEASEAQAYSQPGEGRRGQGSALETFFIIVLIVIFIVFSLVSRVLGFGRRRSGWYGGGYGGGGGWGGGGGSSWGGGGGGFGGGGASSSW